MIKEVDIKDTHSASLKTYILLIYNKIPQDIFIEAVV